MLKIPPKHIHVNDDGKKPFRISEKVANRIKYILILGVLLTTFYAFSSFNSENYIDFLGSQAFIYVAVSYVLIYICWQAFSNKLPGFPVEIVKSFKKPKPLQQTSLITRTNRKAMLFSIIGYTFGMAFSLMVMMFLVVALLSGTGETLVVWNHFGEMMFETVLFICAFIFVIIGYYFTYKNFKHVLRGS